MAKQKTVESKIKDHELIDQRHRQIAEGAVKVFVVKGFHKATVREIAESCGLTEGSLYNYIRSKEDIIYIVYDHITKTLRSEMQAAIDGLDDPFEQLKAALRHNLKVVDRYKEVIMFMYRTSHILDRDSLHDVLARETQYIQLFENLLRASLSEHEVDEFRLKLAADMLAYLPVILTQRRWSLKKRFESMDQVIDGIFDFMLHGIDFIPKD